MTMSDVAQLFAEVRRQGRSALTEPEAKKVLAWAGLAVTREELAHSEGEAAAIAQRIGFPVVLKVVSPDVLHKSDAGGVQIGLANAEEVVRGYRTIMASVAHRHPGAQIHGVLVEEMVQGGVETIVGVTNKPPFGPVVAFGLGGVFVELMKDITFRLAPVDPAEAADMLSDIRGAPMLAGYRGQPAVSKQELARAVACLSALAVAFRDTIQEVDINPLVAMGERAVALDALIILKEKGA